MKAALAAFLGHVGALILDEMPVAFAQTIGILALNVLPLLIRGLLIVVDFGGWLLDAKRDVFELLIITDSDRLNLSGLGVGGGGLGVGLAARKLSEAALGVNFPGSELTRRPLAKPLQAQQRHHSCPSWCYREDSGPEHRCWLRIWQSYSLAVSHSKGRPGSKTTAKHSKRYQHSPTMGLAKVILLLAFAQDALIHTARLSIAVVYNDLSAGDTADATFAIIIGGLWDLGGFVMAFAMAKGQA
jgi:hypothetical protein